MLKIDWQVLFKSLYQTLILFVIIPACVLGSLYVIIHYLSPDMTIAVILLALISVYVYFDYKHKVFLKNRYK